MRRYAIAASLLVPLCACGVRASNIQADRWGGQPQFPLHVHPSLSGKPYPANARAPGRGTQGSPTSPPFLTLDYPDPPMLMRTPPDAPGAVAHAQPVVAPRRHPRPSR